MKENCFYCEDGEKRRSLMIEICKLEVSTVYLNKDQKHKGRCVLKFNDHKTDFSALTPEENAAFARDLRKLACALNKLYCPDKINYAVYGDLVPHLHVHVVPKYKDALQWGGPFTDDIEKKLLTPNEYEIEVSRIRKELES